MLEARSWYQVQTEVQVQPLRRLTRESYLRDMIAVSRPNYKFRLLHSTGEHWFLDGSEKESAGGMGWAGWRSRECAVGRLFGEAAGSVTTAGNWSLTEGAPGKRRHASMGDCCRGPRPQLAQDPC